MITNMIKLSEDTAEQVTGDYGNHNELRPHKIDGISFLPMGVLDSPIFASVHQILGECPIVQIDIGETNE